MHNQHIAPLQTPQHLKQKSGGAVGGRGGGGGGGGLSGGFTESFVTML